VIVRLMGEGQYRLQDDVANRLNELDERAQEALDRDDEGELDRYLDEMAGLVRREGERVPDDEIAASDAIVPPSDLSLEETKQFFSEQGLIPDLPN
jgi:CRP-like cAMP-binding protein